MKKFVTEIGENLEIYLNDNWNTILSVESCQSNTDCATYELFDFCVYKGMESHLDEKTFIDLIKKIVLNRENSSVKCIIFSDSERSNKVYPYIDALKSVKGWTVLEHKTSDGRSTIKKAIFTR